MMLLFSPYIAGGALPTITGHASLTTGLVSHWKLDEASGTRVDAHAANDLTDNNTVTTATGLVGNGAFFDVDNTEYLSITNAAQSGLGVTGDFSIHAYVKLTALPVTGGSMWLASKWNVTGNNRCYRFGLRDTSGVLDMYGSVSNTGSGGSGTTNANLTITPSIDTIYSFGMAYDASAGAIEFYLNGASIGVVSGMKTSIAAKTSEFLIGAIPGEVASSWDGLIEGLSFWNKELTAGEFSDLWNSGSGMVYS